MLSTLWIDQPDAEGNIPAKVTDTYLQERLREFVERGFTIFRGVVDPETLEDIKPTSREILPSGDDPGLDPIREEDI